MNSLARADRGAARIASPVVGAAATLGMLGVYLLVILVASRSFEHLIDQIKADWYLIAPISVGFGVQLGSLVELRRRHRLHRDIAAAGTTGAGTSTVGMLACCAHHVADLLPVLGLTAAATFLYRHRLARSCSWVWRRTSPPSRSLSRDCASCPNLMRRSITDARPMARLRDRCRWRGRGRRCVSDRGRSRSGPVEDEPGRERGRRDARSTDDDRRRGEPLDRTHANR
jgi:hypothetical protein